MRAIVAPRVFFVAIVFAVVSFFSTICASSVYAYAGDVGTHVGQGDIGSQVKTINFVKGKNPPGGYPITVMVDLNSSVGDMQKLADALLGTGFKVNIRVKNITMATSTSEVQTFATNVAQVSWPTSPKPIIIFGNELNAYRGNEWGSSKPSSLQAAAAKYDELLGALEDVLDTKFDLSGVALDPYHADKATEFIDTAQGSFASTRVNSFATNVYQDVPTSSGLGANLQAGVDLYTHLAATAPKARKVFTEFGYNPFDKDVKKHIDFYKTYETTALPGGFESATALIPNLCAENVTDTNQWYYYVVGKIYDENYQEVREDCTAKTDAGTFIYPGPVDNFYNTPGDTNAKMSKFMDIMANDYLLTCSPQIQFQPALNPANPTIVAPNAEGKSALINLLSYCGDRSDANPDNARCLFNIDSQTVSVLADNARVPLIRSEKTGRTGSLEGFFSTDAEGLENLSPGDLTQSFLLTAPYTKLTSRSKICQDNVSFLTAISSTCGNVSEAQQGKITATQTQDQQKFYSEQDRDINSCGLDTKVDGFHLTEIYDRVSGLSGGNVGSYCASPAFAAPQGDEQTTANLVMKVSPITPNAYRIGYLVVYISNKGTDQLTAQAMISRIVRPMDAGYLKSIFKIVPVLLPANFGIQQTNVVRDAVGDPIDGGSFEGALKRTINPLVSSDMMKYVAETAQKSKADVRGKMSEFGGKTVNDGGMVWLPYCNNPLPYSSSGLSNDDTALNCAMADYINANLNIGKGNIIVHPDQEAPCRFYSDLAGGETAEILNSPVKPEWMTDSLKSYSAADTSPSIKVNGQIYASRAQIESMINPEDAKLRVFLAVPEADFGLIKDYEKYLLQTVLSKDLYDKVLEEIAKGKSPETNGFLRMMGVELQTTGGASKPFFTSTEDADAPAGSSTTPKLTTVIGSFDLATSREGANPVLWGGWLSKFAYAYTANITTSEDQKPFNPFDLTNRRLEPYWLGGRQPGNTSADPVTNSCMKVWVTPEVAAEHAQHLRDNLLAQREPSGSFAGWEAYYSGYLPNGKRECANDAQPAAGSYDAVATQYLFESIPECGNKPCYEYIIDRAMDQSSHGTSDGKVVDPYIAIAIALNENGGLKTARVDRQSQHFGVLPPIDGHVKECSEDNEYLGSIPEKLEIMLNTLVGDYGKTGPEALSEYGYSNGGTGLAKIIDYLSSGTYNANSCP